MQCNGLKYFAKKSKNVYCYGIGKWGTCVAKYCKKYHIDITAYIVTKPIKEHGIFYGKPIVGIADVILTNHDGVIIATENKEYKKDMVEKVLSRQPELGNIYYLDKSASVVHYYYKQLKKEALRRKGVDIFSFQKLAQLMPFDVMARDKESRFAYGIAKYVRKYIRTSRYDLDNCTIQHGIALGAVSPAYCNPADHNIFAMSDFDWKSLSDVNVYCMGPLIRYAKTILTRSRISSIKNKLGKTLLVFPVHSGPTGQINEYNIDKFISIIKKIQIQYRFKSVMICLYFSDILKGDYKKYQNEGFKIATAGSYVDENFLRRLKSIILLADVIITNGFGTHIGYAVSMNKPVYIYSMETRDKDMTLIFGEPRICSYEQYEKNRNEVITAFCEYREYITTEQISIVKKYWGDWEQRRGLHRRVTDNV